MTRFYIGNEQVSAKAYAKHLDGLQSSDPNLIQKAVNLAAAAGRLAQAAARQQPVFVSAEEKTRRMAICGTCEFFTGTTCRKCGCQIRFKAKLQTEHCPLPEPKW